MKPLVSALAGNIIITFCAASMLGFMAACATVASSPQHETDEQALEQLRSGKGVLDCGQSCADAWHYKGPKLIAHYNAGDWRELALLVIQTGYHQDLGYFYLGRAAEGLGDSSAALVYYKAAEALATGTAENVKCTASRDGCNGLSLLTEILTRMQIIDSVRDRNAWAVRRQQHSRAAPGQPASNPVQPATDKWVDPPPASP